MVIFLFCQTWTFSRFLRNFDLGLVGGKFDQIKKSEKQMSLESSCSHNPKWVDFNSQFCKLSPPSTTVFIFGFGSPTTALNFGFGSQTTALNFWLGSRTTLGLGLEVRLQFSTLSWVVRL